jgi:hypothetical protein
MASGVGDVSERLAAAAVCAEIRSILDAADDSADWPDALISIRDLVTNEGRAEWETP